MLKREAMVVGRKPKKVDMRIKDKSVEHVDSFKYLECNVKLNCCQEVKRRIVMTKEAFNRKISIFCGPLGKEVRKRLVKCLCVVYRYMVQRPGHYDGMSKNY